MPIEPIQLDDRNFEQIFAEARARIRVHTPEWTNFNESDPGITLVQLFAFMTDNLLYRSNRIPEANRRKFLMLLGIGLQPATPGQGLVFFLNDRGPLKAFPLDRGQVLQAGNVKFLTRTDVNILPVTAAAFYKKPQSGLDQPTKQQYQLLYQTFLNTSVQELQFYKATQLAEPADGKPDPVVDLADSVGVNGTIDRSLWVALLAPPNVPINTMRSAIAGQTLSLGIYPALGSDGSVLRPASFNATQQVDFSGLVFQVAQPDPSPTNPDVGQSTGQPKYKTLPVEYAENVLDYPGIVNVRLPEYKDLILWDFDPEEEGTGDYPPIVEDKSLAQRIVTWLRIGLPSLGTTPQGQPMNARGVGPLAHPQSNTQLTWVGVNAARVIQAVKVQNEPLGIGTGAPDQSYKVANTPLLLQNTSVFALGTSGEETLIVQVQNVNNVWESWHYIDDLYAAGPSDKVFTVDAEAGKILFGNGLNGYRPSVDSNIRVSYEYGGGLAGQVQIGAINKGTTLPGGFKVKNPLPTWGAGPAETAEEGERNIPRYLRHRDRLVTANDFRDITMRTPGVDIGRVAVLPLFNPELFDVDNTLSTWPGALTVLVIPRTDLVQPDAPLPDRRFLDSIATWLEPRRLLTTEVFIRGPVYVPLWVSVGVVTLPGRMRDVVQHDVLNAIRDYLSPLTGGPPPDNQLTLEAACLSSTSAGMPCIVGTGWPLGMDVRRQDLEAVAARVAGVRYVDSVKLGITPENGTTLTDVESVPIMGLQLPRLLGVSVREGAATDVADLLGLNVPPPPGGGPTGGSGGGPGGGGGVPAGGAGGGGVPPSGPNTVPVPVLPKKC